MYCFTRCRVREWWGVPDATSFVFWFSQGTPVSFGNKEGDHEIKYC